MLIAWQPAALTLECRVAQVIEFESLGTADLIVNAIYEGTNQLASDPISRLLPRCGNMGGFRLAGKGQDKQFVALFTHSPNTDGNLDPPE